MNRYKIDENTIWEDTGEVVVNNYPPSGKTFSYAQRVYREYKTDKFGWVEVKGEPIYFHDMPTATLALAIIMSNAQNALNQVLPINKELKISASIYHDLYDNDLDK